MAGRRGVGAAGRGGGGGVAGWRGGGDALVPERRQRPGFRVVALHCKHISPSILFSVRFDVGRLNILGWSVIVKRFLHRISEWMARF